VSDVVEPEPGPIDAAGAPMSPAEILARRSLVALVPFARSGDLMDPPDGVAIASLDDAGLIDMDASGRALLAAWSKRPDRVFLFDEARPGLRRLLRAGVDVARPICRNTLERLAGASVDDTGNIMRDPLAASLRAKQIVHKLESQLERVDERGHKKVARLENLVLRAFAALEDRGMPIDAPAWKALVNEDRALASAAKDEIFRLAGAHIARDLFGTPEINLDADADVRALLERSTGKKLDDVARGSLAALKHPVADALLKYRESHKIVSTYGDAFLSRVDPRDGRIHATFIPLGASTGRVASRDPNLQNLPSDARFHTCLRAPAGHALVTADYATCELRIVAELAQDPVFLAAFARGDDLHSTVASTMFGVPVSKSERPELRQRAKAINFGLVYGMGPAALATSLSVPLEEGERLLQQYFRTFPRVRDYLEHNVDQALSRGYAETVLGRRLRFDKDALSAPNARGELSRIAKNMPIQGTSADMTKLAMVRVHERLVDEHLGGLVNTVHDELVVECRAEDGARVAEAVQHEMAEAHRTLLRTVPPLVEVHVGPHWHH
jgi:DNA polymerase-1